MTAISIRFFNCWIFKILFKLISDNLYTFPILLLSAFFLYIKHLLTSKNKQITYQIEVSNVTLKISTIYPLISPKPLAVSSQSNPHQTTWQSARSASHAAMRLGWRPTARPPS